MQIIGGDIAGMFLDDAVTDTEPQASALAGALGSEERIKNTVQIGKARTIVAESYDNLVALDCGFDRDLLLLEVANRIESVVENVQKYLLEQILLNHYAGKISSNVGSELNSLTAELIGAQLQHIINYGSQRKRLTLELGLAGKVQQSRGPPAAPALRLWVHPAIYSRTARRAGNAAEQ